MRLVSFIIIVLNISCGIRLEQNFDYEERITPEEISQDVEQLRRDLKNKHIDINWEGKQKEIFNDLDELLNIDNPITIDSFEARIDNILENIDDGHSRVIRQDSINAIRPNRFGVFSINDSMIYIRLGNFVDRAELTKSLRVLERMFQNDEHDELIIDLRWNKGGNLLSVRRALSYFIPSKTKLFKQVKCKPSSTLGFLASKLRHTIHNSWFLKKSGKAKISGSPQVYLWINQEIASGSMIFTYHVQNNGGIVIGEPPKGIYNTFGNAYGYRLKNSRIVYMLASCRLYLSEEKPSRAHDMIIPDHVPDKNMDLEGLVKLINRIKE